MGYRVYWPPGERYDSLYARLRKTLRQDFCTDEARASCENDLHVRPKEDCYRTLLFYIVTRDARGSEVSLT